MILHDAGGLVALCRDASCRVVGFAGKISFRRGFRQRVLAEGCGSGRFARGPSAAARGFRSAAAATAHTPMYANDAGWLLRGDCG